MEKKLYMIEEKTYIKHIDDEVHLYGLLRQLAFLAGKVKEPEDAEHLMDTARRYGEIAEEKFEGWNIPGRYMVFGDKADLAGLMKKELAELEVFDADEETENEGESGLRDDFAVFLDTLADMAEKARYVADALEGLLDVSEDE